MRGKIRWRRIPLRAGAGLVGLFVTAFVTYFVAINALLLTGAAKLVVNRMAPTHVHFEWERAYSTWFMRVHATGFVFRGEDSSVQWLITADRADATFGLLDFFARRVRLHDARASGLSARIRFKLDPAEATADYVERLPPIAGFSDPPLKPSMMPPPPTDDHYDLWTVDIDDAVGNDVREVWVDTIRAVDAHGYIAGGFYLKPLRRFFVRPTRCAIDNGAVLDGKDTIAASLRGAFELRIAEIDLRATHGVDVVPHLDAKAMGQAKLGDLRFLDRWLTAEHVTASGGAAVTQFAVELSHGELVSTSRAWVRSEGLHVWSGHDGLSGALLVNAVIPEGKAYLSLSAEAYALGIHRGKSNVAYAPVVSVLMRVDSLDMSKPFDRWAMSVDAPETLTSHLEALNAYLDEPMLHGGSGTLSAHVNVTPEAMAGHLKVGVSNAVVEVSKAAVTLSGTGEATLHSFDRRTGKGDLAGARVSLTDVSGGEQRGWWLSASAYPLSVTLTHGMSVAGMFTGKCRDAQLPLAVLGASSMVRNAFGSHGFTGASEVRLSPRVTDVTDLRLIGNSVEVRAHYHSRDGAAFVDTPLINVGVLFHDGQMSTHLFVTRDWYARTLEAKPRADVKKK